MSTARAFHSRFALILAGLTLCTSPLIGQVSEGTIYEIRSVDEPSKCIDIQSASHSNGALAQIHTCNDGLNQRWKFVLANPGSYRMIAIHSKKCLDVKGADHSDGRNVQQYSCHGGLNQLWDDIPDGSNVKFIVNHTNKCLEAKPSGLFRQRDILEQRTCSSDNRQKWKLEVKAICGNGICESSQGEGTDCPDCAPAPSSCPNGLCEPGEDCSWCPDCGPCSTCDFTCNGRSCSDSSDCSNGLCPQGWCDSTGTCVCLGLAQ